MTFIKKAASTSNEELREELINRMGEDGYKRFGEDMERWNSFEVIKGGKEVNL